MTIGEKIRAARKAKGYTMDDLAKALNTTKQTIHKYEHGIVTNLPLNRVIEIAEVLDVEPGYLTGWDETAPAPDPLEEKRQRLLGELGKLSEEDILKVLEYAKFITRDK